MIDWKGALYYLTNIFFSATILALFIISCISYAQENFVYSSLMMLGAILVALVKIDMRLSNMNKG